MLPLQNYRQLLMDGVAPDTIKGLAITSQLISAKNIFFRYEAGRSNVYDMGLNIMFEAWPKRLGVELPGDVFRMGNDIEFIDCESNMVNEEKSAMFRKALEKAGYAFPCRWVKGNNSTRKRYDEGFFTEDANGEIFHMKMVNGRPFVRNTHLSDTIDIVSYHPYEPGDRRFYGFVFCEDGGTYIIGNEEGKYCLQKLDIMPFDPENDKMNLIGDPLNWTVNVTRADGFHSYALDVATLERVNEAFLPHEASIWESVSRVMFPCYLQIMHENTKFIYPRVVVNWSWGWVINILLAVAVFFIRRQEKRWTISLALLTLLSGISGFIALLLVPQRRED